MAIMVLSGRQRESHAYWLSRRAGVTKNFDWTRLLRGHRPTPHLPIYRDTLFFALADGGFERIQALPFPLYILTAILPAFLPAPVAVAAGIVAYSVEKKLRRGLVHPTWSPRMGFRPLIVDARGCASPTQLTELVLASSATPPFTPVGRIGEHRLLDGGMIDNAPAFIGEGVAGVSRHLIVLTRPYPAASIGRQGARWYFAPSRPLPINRWDYTSAERVESTIALGADHAELAESDLVRFLAD